MEDDVPLPTRGFRFHGIVFQGLSKTMPGYPCHPGICPIHARYLLINIPKDMDLSFEMEPPPPMGCVLLCSTILPILILMAVAQKTSALTPLEALFPPVWIALRCPSTRVPSSAPLLAVALRTPQGDTDAEADDEEVLPLEDEGPDHGTRQLRR